MSLIDDLIACTSFDAYSARLRLASHAEQLEAYERIQETPTWSDMDTELGHRSLATCISAAVVARTYDELKPWMTGSVWAWDKGRALVTGDTGQVADVAILSGEAYFKARAARPKVP